MNAHIHMPLTRALAQPSIKPARQPFASLQHAGGLYEPSLPSRLRVRFVTNLRCDRVEPPCGLAACAQRTCLSPRPRLWPKEHNSSSNAMDVTVPNIAALRRGQGVSLSGPIQLRLHRRTSVGISAASIPHAPGRRHATAQNRHAEIVDEHIPPPPAANQIHNTSGITMSQHTRTTTSQSPEQRASLNLQP